VNPAVLVVDDEEKILDVVKSYLGKNGYTALCAGTGKEALDLFQRHQVSLVLLDLMLPDFSGEELCRKIRAVSDVPIIMMTAKVEEEDIIRGLHLGADDYVTKPFSPRQLMARAAAALRRYGSVSHSAPVLTAGDLTVDTEKHLVSLKGGEVALTPDEFNILKLLMSHRGRGFSRDEIISEIKSGDYEGFDRAIDTHIKNLRRKIEIDPRSPRFILTVYGIGYRFGGETGARP
jgi:DNA-binding response OmpR family regulator